GSPDPGRELFPLHPGEGTLEEVPGVLPVPDVGRLPGIYKQTVGLQGVQLGLRCEPGQGPGAQALHRFGRLGQPGLHRERLLVSGAVDCPVFGDCGGGGNIPAHGGLQHKGRGFRQEET
ncbi:hypothetical protein NHX12_027663, partial [Muraenolepis orangiensis]